MKDRILIKKTLIPYSFDIALPDDIYNIVIFYNSTADFFTVQLSKGDEVLCSGEPLVYGMPLFGDIADRRFPTITIVPQDESENYNQVTFDNFNETVFLCVEE